MIITSARPDDAAAIIRVHHRAVWALQGGPYSATVLAAWSPTPDAAREAWMRDRIADDALKLWVAKDRDGEICGFSMCETTRGFIRAVYVAPEHAGTGIGKTLLVACESHYRDSGVAQVGLNASVNAVRFYQSQGYRIESEGTQTLGDGTAMDCVVMAKAIL